jgi:hypothetical protein
LTWHIEAKLKKRRVVESDDEEEVIAVNKGTRLHTCTEHKLDNILDRPSSRKPASLSSKGKGKAKDVVEQEVADEMNQGAAEASSADEGEDEVFSEDEELEIDGTAAASKR